MGCFRSCLRVVGLNTFFIGTLTFYIVCCQSQPFSTISHVHSDHTENGNELCLSRPPRSGEKQWSKCRILGNSFTKPMRRKHNFLEQMEICLIIWLQFAFYCPFNLNDICCFSLCDKLTNVKFQASEAVSGSFLTVRGSFLTVKGSFLTVFSMFLITNPELNISNV